MYKDCVITTKLTYLESWYKRIILGNPGTDTDSGDEKKVETGAKKFDEEKQGSKFLRRMFSLPYRLFPRPHYLPLDLRGCKCIRSVYFLGTDTV